MEFGISLSIEQKQSISQTQIQSLEILAMDNLELGKLMENEYLENPLLEQYGKKTESPIIYNQKDERNMEIPFCDDEKEIKDVLMSQITLSDFAEEELRTIRLMIGNLDRNGFFPYEAEEFAKIHKVDQETFWKCLNIMRNLEPYGVFAQNLSECLLKQLEIIGEKDEIATTVLKKYLSDLANGKIAKISRETGYSTLKIKKCLQKIKTLNPRPLLEFNSAETTSYIVPDIVVHYEKETEQLVSAINDVWIPDYEISDYYFHMMEHSKDEELKKYFEDKYVRAKFLIHSIEQRRETILRIGNYIAQKQFDFLMGKGAKKAETMSTCAAELHLAVSTVSRAVKGKYLQYPAGNIFLKDLFMGSVAKSEESDDRTSDDIKEKIKEFIDKEEKRKPLSDMEIVKRLEMQGMKVSRRAIAKYRDQLGIKGSFERKTV